MILPSPFELHEQKLIVVPAEGRKDGLRQVILNRLVVLLVELLGPIERVALCAHVVADGVDVYIFAGAEEVTFL